MPANTYPYSKVELHTDLRCPDCPALIPMVVTLTPKRGKPGELKARLPKKWGRVLAEHARNAPEPHPTILPTPS